MGHKGISLRGGQKVCKGYILRENKKGRSKAKARVEQFRNTVSTLNPAAAYDCAEMQHLHRTLNYLSLIMLFVCR